MPSTSETRGGPDAWGVLDRLWRVIQAVTDDSAPALEALGLSPKAFFLLSSVEECPFPAELARRMHLPPPTVTYMVKLMEAKRFLKRHPEPGDLRKFRLVVTARGRKAIAEGRAAIGAAMAARLARLDPAEVGPFERVVVRLARPPDK